MRMRRWTPALVLGVVAVHGLAGCERELTLDPKVDKNAVVVAQFDPTHPVPVLRIVPSPTALAQTATGLKVDVAPCEMPSVKQCLAFVNGWPATTPVTLFFSGEIDETSLADGVKIYREGSLSPLTFTAEVGPRPAPPAACQAGGNGSSPERTYTSADVPRGIQVVITPEQGFEGATKYLLIVESYEEGGAVKGVRSKTGKRIEPADLFFLLNTDTSPITAEGEITNALLRTNITSSVLSATFPGRALADLSSDERATLAKGVAATAKDRLLPVYGFFDQILKPLSAAGITSRNKVIFANAWSTASAPGEIEFDPLVGKFPFPNVPLMTATTGPGLNDLQVTLPINPCGDPPTPGCDSPSAVALKGGLNTLNGFSTLAPIALSASVNLKSSTLQPNILFYPLNDQGAIDGEAVPFAVRTASTTTASPSAPIVIQPLQPLQQNKTYVIGLKRGIQNADGVNVTRATTFTLLTAEDSLVVGGEFNTAATVNLGGADVPVGALLQCSTVGTEGRLATDDEVLEKAMAIETRLQHARWKPAFDALAGAPAPLTGDDVLLAFTIKTQGITDLLDQVKAQLLPGVWDAQVRTASGTPRITGPLLTVEGFANIVGFLGVAKNLCLPLCLGGALQGIAPNACAEANGDPTAAVVNHQMCQAAGQLVASNLGSIRMYLMANYRVTGGNPYTAGTFSRERILQPEIIQTPLWVVTASAAGPAAGQPVVMFQHGLGRAKEDGFYIANTFASAGYATVLMDLPFHGSRASDVLNNTTGQPCLAADPNAVACDPTTHTCVGGCDGVQDPSGATFLVSNVFASRDNFRQAAIDHLTVLRALQQESDAGEILEYLDGARVAYAGQSLGGITGGNFLAYAPEITAAALNVAGGGLMNILLQTVPAISGTIYGPLVAAGVCEPKVPGNPGAGCKDTAAFRQFLVTAQWALDPGDPLATSIGVMDPHGPVTAPLGSAKILMQVAVPDRVIANSTSRALAGAYEFDPSDNSATSHFQTYTMPDPGTASGCHGFILSPICGTNPLDAVCNTFGAQQQAARFIASNGATVGSRSPNLPGLCP